MPAYLNRVTLIGNLGRDPETHGTQSGQVVRFSVATTRTWKDNSGTKKEETEWHDCCAFGKLSEIIAQYASKGMQVFIEGRLRRHNYTDKNGIEKSQTDIIVEDFKMLGGKGKSGATTQPAQPVQSAPQSGYTSNPDDDDCPF